MLNKGEVGEVIPTKRDSVYYGKVGEEALGTSLNVQSFGSKSRIGHLDGPGKEQDLSCLGRQEYIVELYTGGRCDIGIGSAIGQPPLARLHGDVVIFPWSGL